MNRINILDTTTSNKIAAGEVVERPASVVKELVENSLDASSKKITIEIENGGDKLIKINDNGIGIHPDDVEKAFTTHATSKISKIEDIFSINTLGFRGEALPSIASVSHTTLSSRSNEFDYGKEIKINGGEVEYIKEIGKSVGTIVTIEDLFYNVPARQKFLKTSKREGSLISDLVMRLALSNSDVAFRLFKDGKKSVETHGTGNLKDTIRALYGKKVFENIIEFENHNDTVSIHGFIGNADISKGSRNNQSIFVNKRYIKNRMITTAVENAFKSFLTVNKFPFFVLFIDIYPELIDVNIHPTKSEIKFFDDRNIFKLVFDGVHKALRKDLENSFMIDTEIQVDEKEIFINKDKFIKLNEELEVLDSKKENINIPIDLKNTRSDENSIDFNIKPSLVSKTNHLEFNDKTKEITESDDVEGLNKYQFLILEPKESLTQKLDIDNIQQQFSIIEEETKPTEEYIRMNLSCVNKIPKFGKIKIIGQFNKTYILGELNKDLYIIDQHAAHEKILFEKYSRDIDNKKVVSQVLLTSVVLELSHDEFSIYLENEEIFKRVGFHIENFGDNTINIREVPLIINSPNAEKLFNDILNNLINMGNAKNSEIKFESIARLACRSAVKANDELSTNEMEHLLEELRFIEEPFTCPHGRPTIIRYTLKDVEKMFKRIQ